jgi:alkanesulfonate monooxygenase SsuD/methylene tetrahydromethanopterin reductase-like flavin-dependent oxidoreductase (luciferase family)
VAASRRLSHRISEGDEIAFIVHVTDAAAARQAEEDGAKALAADAAIAGIREATTLPLLWLGGGPPVSADAVAIRHGEDGQRGHDGLETVVDVRDEDELERALEELDPDIFLLSPPADDDDVDPVESVLELLPDVPAG